ncbi:MAG: hypothetical protein HY902_20650 [Deltaproteobacteria bacterium]|nr:hypothetical protein [Deltaproteobacteria bacterium]
MRHFAPLVVSLCTIGLLGCGLGATVTTREVRHHQVDESALVPVPVGPHAIGPMGASGEVRLQASANHTQSPSIDRGAEDAVSQYYLENVGQARLSVATSNYIEYSLGIDYGHASWSRSSLARTNLPVPGDYALWLNAAMRGRVPITDHLAIAVGGEVAGGWVPYYRHVHSDITTETWTTENTNQYGQVDPFRAPKTTYSSSSTQEDSITTGDDVNMAWTALLGLQIEPMPRLHLDVTLFGQLVPVYPGHREATETCTDGDCVGTSPDELAVSHHQTAFGASLAATWELTEHVLAVVEAHVHRLELPGTQRAIWPGLVAGLQVPLGKLAAKQPAKPALWGEHRRSGMAGAVL